MILINKKINMNFVAFDFETSTNDRNSPCEIGLTFVENWEIINTKSWLIKPINYPYFKPYNISIHGIKPLDVANEPEFDFIWKEVKPLIDLIEVKAIHGEQCCRVWCHEVDSLLNQTCCCALSATGGTSNAYEMPLMLCSLLAHLNGS
jgi:hypothetical protein